MKMAKMSENDINAGGRLLQILEEISNTHHWSPVFGWHASQAADAADWEAVMEEGFDPDQISHLASLFNELSKLLHTAPGFACRLIGGMCYVVMYDKNNIIDPNSDTLDLHPDIIEGMRLLAEKRKAPPALDLEALAQQARERLATFIDDQAKNHQRELRKTLPITVQIGFSSERLERALENMARLNQAIRASVN